MKLFAELLILALAVGGWFYIKWEIDECCARALDEEIGADVHTDAPPRAVPQRPSSGTLGADTPFDWADAS